MAGDRLRRVNEALREVLSARVAAGLKDPRIGFVTVTSVETSPDLTHARVYVSVLGEDEEREDSLAGLNHSRGYLQAAIAEEVRMKRTPTLEFLHDDSIDHGFRISELLEGHGEDSASLPNPSESHAKDSASLPNPSESHAKDSASLPSPSEGSGR